MYKQEHKKLKELQFLQATNFLLLCKLIPNLKQEKNFIFSLPMSDGENKKNSEVDFRLKKMSNYTSNLEILMSSPINKKIMKLNLRIYHEAKLVEVTRFQNFHVSLLEIFQTSLKFGFLKDERLQWNSFTKEFLNLCLEEGRSVETFIPSWL
ncbi:MAG: hypothetical protein CMK55_05100 [Proteobacteria bacterium]|nr:hypothetical protein [Pseudomonadota bacterium]|tara:strand:- start:139 stop:594 length:456 start_codon:yes stop_codon:yes gene_type:complete